MRKILLLPILVLALAGTARAAEPAAADAPLVAQCRGELEERLFGTGPRGEAFITAQQIEHQADRVLVRLDLASGEGRRVAGTCIFKDGKLFDVK